MELSEQELDPAGRERAPYPSWLLLEIQGPFRDREALLLGLAEALAFARDAPGDRFRVAGQGLAAICNALESLGTACPTPEERR